MPYFVNPNTGQLFEAEPEDQAAVADLERQGLVPATQQDIEEHNKREIYGTAGQQTQAAGETALRSLTFGLAPGFGSDEEIRSRAQVFEQESPILSGAASLVPDVATAAVTGGLAGLGRAAGRMAASQAGTLGRRIIAATAAESLITGAQQEGAASYVDDRDFAAENVARNALINAAFSFGAVGVGAAGAKALGKSRNFLAEAAGSGSKAGRKLPGGSAGAASADEFDDLATMAVESINQPQYRASVIELADQADGILQRNAVAAADRLDDMQAASKVAGYEHKIEDFRKFEGAWTPELRAEQVNAVDTSVGEATSLLERLDELTVEGKGDFGAKARTVQDKIRRDAERLAAAPEGADKLIALDRLKRTLDESVSSLQSTRGGKADPDAQRAWIDEILPVANKQRARLEDASVWGDDVAELQKGVNSGFHQEIEAGNRVSRALYERLDDDFGVVGSGAANKRARAEAVEAWMKKDPAHTQGFDRDLQDFIEGRERRLEAFAQAGIEPPPELRVGLDAAKEMRTLFNTSRVVSIAKKRAPEVAGKLTKREKIFQQLMRASDYAGGALATGGIPVKIPVSDILRAGAKKFGSRGLRAADDPFLRVLSSTAELWAKDAPRVTPDLDAGWTDFVRDLTQSKMGRNQPPSPSTPGAGALPVQPRPPESPVSMAGKSLDDMGAYELDPDDSIEWFLQNDEFRRTGRVSENDPGISVEAREGQPYLHDGRHRVSAARELGMPAVYGRVTNAEGEEVFQGMIPVADIADQVRPPVAGAGVARRAVVQSIEKLRREADLAEEVYTAGDVKKWLRESAEARMREMLDGVPDEASLAELSQVIQSNPAFVQQAEDVVVRAVQSTEKGPGVAKAGADMRKSLQRAGLVMAPILLAMGTAGEAGASVLQERAAEYNEDQQAVVDTLNEIATDGELLVERVAAGVVSGDLDEGDLDGIEDFEFGDIEKWREALNEPPDALLDRIGDSWGALPETDPEVFQAIIRKMAKVRSYLSERIPPRPGKSITRPEGFPVAAADSARFADIVLGATAPKTAMLQAVAGRARPAAIRALRENWPSLWQRLLISVVAEYQDAVAEDKPVSPGVVQQMDRDFGLGPLLGALHSPRLTQFLAQEAEGRARQGQATDFPGGTRLTEGLTPEAMQTFNREAAP